MFWSQLQPGETHDVSQRPVLAERRHTRGRTGRGAKRRRDIGLTVERAVTASRYLILFLPILGGMPSEKDYFGSIVEIAGDSTKDMLAAQIRDQEVACDNPVRTVRDAKRSKPDYDVWVLTCENATYRVSRHPDLAAKIERLR